MVSSSMSRCAVPQTELPVSGVVEVPPAQRLGPAHEIGALHYELSERGLRHDCGYVCGDDGGRRCVVLLLVKPSLFSGCTCKTRVEPLGGKRT